MYADFLRRRALIVTVNVRLESGAWTTVLTLTTGDGVDLRHLALARNLSDELHLRLMPIVIENFHVCHDLRRCNSS